MHISHTPPSGPFCANIETVGLIFAIRAAGIQGIAHIHDEITAESISERQKAN